MAKKHNKYNVRIELNMDASKVKTYSVSASNDKSAIKAAKKIAEKESFFQVVLSCELAQNLQ